MDFRFNAKKPSVESDDIPEEELNDVAIELEEEDIPTHKEVVIRGKRKKHDRRQSASPGTDQV